MLYELKCLNALMLYELKEQEPKLVANVPLNIPLRVANTEALERKTLLIFIACMYNNNIEHQVIFLQYILYVQDYQRILKNLSNFQT